MAFPIANLTRPITASGQVAAIPCLQAIEALVQMVATSLVGHDCAIEGSVDSTNGTDGNWVAVAASRSNAPGTVEASTGVLAATPAYAWRVNCRGFRFIRFRATAHTSGTATYLANTILE